MHDGTLWALIGIVVVSLASIWQYGRTIKKNFQIQDTIERQLNTSERELKWTDELQTRNQELLERQERLLDRIEKLLTTIEERNRALDGHFRAP